jgi:hypothetical protein
MKVIVVSQVHIHIHVLGTITNSHIDQAHNPHKTMDALLLSISSERNTEEK